MHAQVPLRHGPPAGHTVPQEPQLRLFVSTLTQLFPHKVSPAATLHPAPQTPPAHIWPAGQTLPQAPQLRGSIWVSEQEMPQRVVLAPQAH